MDLINIDYPQRFVDAIQDTELAKQERQTAVFAKTEQIIRAVTKTEQARVTEGCWETSTRRVLKGAFGSSWCVCQGILGR